VGLDVGTEEASDLVPLAPAGEQSPYGQDPTGVAPPHRAPEARGRDVEVHAREHAAGLQYPSELGHGRRGIADVAQEIGEGHVVETVVGEGQVLGPALDEAYARFAAT
jgi:hypothetical protein